MVTKSVLPFLTYAVVGAVAAGFAHGQGAPIVYGETQRAEPAPQTVPADSRLAPTGDVRTDRIIFRYPGTEAPIIEPQPVQPDFEPAARAPRQMAALQPHDAHQLTAPMAASRPVQSESFELERNEVRITSIPQSPTTPSTSARNMAPLRISKVSSTDGATLSEERGLVGMYPDGFEGKPTANGEVFKSEAMTGAHPTLPLPSLVQLVNARTGQEVVVRVNDRGPFMADRVMDVSPGAARALGIEANRPANLRVRYLGPAPVQMKPKAAVQHVAMTAQAEPRAFVQPQPMQAPRAEAVIPRDVAMPDTPETPQGNLFIQAGSFADIGNAQRLTEQLGRGLPVRIEAARVNGADYFRVMVGPFGTRSAADSVRDRLERSGTVSGYIVKR
ncbi:MAG: septal ring lytic transglycosylase RlpA family protein [Pseudomonadota bacterium]